MEGAHELRPVLVTADSSRKVIRAKVNPNQIPDSLLNDGAINYQIQLNLPSNYNFEIHKIIWRIRQLECKRVALQFPEGLFIFSSAIAKLIELFTDCKAIIIGDVTYGACCIEDYVASLAGCSLVVHFAHSCLVPIQSMLEDVKALYVFVDIKFDSWHFFESMKLNFGSCKKRQKICLLSTIQFVNSIQSISRQLLAEEDLIFDIPQIRPLSKGEVLGCTAPQIPKDTEIVVFVADGRFHLEAVMIANPWIKTFYRYNPYNKELTEEAYEFDKMIKMRQESIAKASMALRTGKANVGLILGTLGHQGSPAILRNLENAIIGKFPQTQVMTFLIPEIKPAILNSFGDSIDFWIQTSCPRLSIDWGSGFIDKPLLNPYELNLTLNKVKGVGKDTILLSERDDVGLYPMDYYARDSLGNWTPNHKCNSSCSCES